MDSQDLLEALEASRCILLSGKPGSGKTTFAVSIADWLRPRHTRTTFFTNDMSLSGMCDLITDSGFRTQDFYVCESQRMATLPDELKHLSYTEGLLVIDNISMASAKGLSRVQDLLMKFISLHQMTIIVLIHEYSSSGNLKDRCDNMRQASDIWLSMNEDWSVTVMKSRQSGWVRVGQM